MNAAGNVIGDTVHQYVYDAENQIETVTDAGVSYIYDAEGRRVGKPDGTVYVVTPSGDVLDQLNNGQWTRSEITLGGHHLATLTQAGVVFTQADWVGTERLRKKTDTGLVGRGGCCALRDLQRTGRRIRHPRGLRRSRFLLDVTLTELGVIRCPCPVQTWRSSSAVSQGSPAYSSSPRC